MKNLLVGQSGGPTAAINATLAGVIAAGIKSEEIGTVYGCVNGIEGALKDNLMNLSEFFADADKIAPYAKNSVGALSEYSIINGFTDNTFRGTEVCSRAQAAKIISGAITIYNAIRMVLIAIFNQKY